MPLGDRLISIRAATIAGEPMVRIETAGHGATHAPHGIACAWPIGDSRVVASGSSAHSEVA